MQIFFRYFFTCKYYKPVNLLFSYTAKLFQAIAMQCISIKLHKIGHGNSTAANF